MSRMNIRMNNPVQNDGLNRPCYLFFGRIFSAKKSKESKSNFTGLSSPLLSDPRRSSTRANVVKRERRGRGAAKKGEEHRLVVEMWLWSCKWSRLPDQNVGWGINRIICNCVGVGSGKPSSISHPVHWQTRTVVHGSPPHQQRRTVSWKGTQRRRRRERGLSGG